MSPSIETNGYGSLFPVTLRNNLFLAGSLNFNDYNNYCFYQDITVADNLFVQCAFSYYSDLGYGPRNISYNGWYQTTALHGSAPVGSGACGAYGPAVNGGDVLLTNLDFQVGPLGNYYYPPGGTNLARLIDAGDMSASAAGLANYTTQTNQTPEGCTTVDIGFHYKCFGGNLLVDTNYTALQLAQLLVPPGVWVTNAIFTNVIEARGIFSNGVPAGLPINYGVILSSGCITNAIGTNDDDGSIAGGVYGDGPSNLGQPGDSDLNKLVDANGTLDAAVLEFDIISTNSFTLQFQYIFASEEYPEYIGQYNDPMAIFVSTNRIGAAWVNSITNDIALVPGTNLPVSVGNINGGYTNMNDGAFVLPTNPQYYVDNCDPYNSALPPYAASTPVYNLQYDGFTTLLTAQTNISANVTYHIKIGVADYAGTTDEDRIYDSAILIKGWTPCN
jgi:hypothetical protein